MKIKTPIIILLLLFPILIFSQGGLVNNGAILKISSSTDLKINDGGVINRNSGLISNEGNLYLDLDFTQLGATTDYTGNGWVEFEGSANQDLTSASKITIANLKVNNSNRLVLNSNLTISREVDLSNNGLIELGTSDLLLVPSATINNYGPSHYIVTNSTGVLEQEVGISNLVFPVGNTTYNPATINNTGIADNFRLRVEDRVYSQGTTGTLETVNIVNRTWHLSEGIPGGSSVNLTVQWAPAEELTGFNRNASGVAHFQGGAWIHPSSYTAATPVSSFFTQSLSGINSFSPFAVEDIVEALPIELLHFNAKRSDKNTVKLDWSTAAEINNSGFEIERMLDTETEFSKIGWVDGAGNSSYMLNYATTDLNAHSGVSYYRLKQIDFDGSYSYSPIRAVEGLQVNSGSIQIYPNPVKNTLIIDFSNWNLDTKDVTLKVMDVYGRVLLTKAITIQQNDLMAIDEIADFPTGTYFVAIGDQEAYEFVQKIIKE